MTGHYMHFADRLIHFDRARRYQQDNNQWMYGKPNGFWISATSSDDWPAWCLREDFRLDTLRFAHTVTLSSGAYILRLHTPQNLHYLHDTYATPSEFDVQHGYGRRHWGIDWRQVAARYDGIIITPYQWTCRSDYASGKTSWYYSWDCASGCIWNPDAIQSVDLHHFPALTAGLPSASAVHA